MTKDPTTYLMVETYKADPCPATIHLIADLYNLSYKAVVARLIRAGAKGKPVPDPMYHTQETVVEAFRKLGSVTAVVAKLGVSYYAVTRLLDAHGIQRKRQTPGARKDRKGRLFTFYYWRNRDRSLPHIKWIVATHSRYKDHAGTVLAANLQDAVRKLDHAVTRRQLAQLQLHPVEGR